MDYAGSGKVDWFHMLDDEALSLRLFALRVFAQQGESGWQVLESRTARDGETYPWLWALAQCAPCPLPSNPPALRFLLRRREPKRAWVVRRTRGECIEALAAASHPLQILACAVRLLELHGEEAIPALLDFLRQPPASNYPEKADCAAWALGQLGRAAVPEIVQVYGDSSVRVRRHLAMALWYLGAEAVRAIPTLLDHPSPEANAALLAMEGVSSRIMAQRRRLPLWLDDGALEELALAAYSDDGDARRIAACGLGGFGPASGKVFPVLRHLAGDDDFLVRLWAVEGLRGNVEALPVFLYLESDPNLEVREDATEAIDDLLSRTEVTLQKLLDIALESKSALGDKAMKVGMPEDRERDIATALSEADQRRKSHVLSALVRHGSQLGSHRDAVLGMLRNDSTPQLRSFAVRLIPMLGLTALEAWDVLWPLLEDSDDHLVALAARGLFDLNLDSPALVAVLQQMRGPAGAILLESPVDTPLLLALLESRSSRTRLAAVGKLGLLTHPEKAVTDALKTCLKDSDQRVVLAAARALLGFGFQESAWLLLAASDPPQRSLAYQSVRANPPLPKAMLQAFARGELCNPATFRLVDEMVPEPERLTLLILALPHLAPDLLPTARQSFSRLGLGSLDALDEFLRHPQLSLREQAVHALGYMLRTAPEPAECRRDGVCESGSVQVSWLVNRAPLDSLPGPSGIRLPLSEPDPVLEQQLKEIMVRFVCSWADSDPRLLPWLSELSRCSHAEIAVRAVNGLANAFTRFGEIAYLEALLDACSHAQAAVRGRALHRLRTLPPPLKTRFSELGPEPDREALIERLYLQEQLNGLSRDEFRLLVKLASGRDWGLQTPVRFARLSKLLVDSDPLVSAEAARLLTASPLELEPEFSTLLHYFRDASAYHRLLVERWPHLVYLLFVEDPDRLEWLEPLGSLAETGLAMVLRKGDHRAVALSQIDRMADVGETLLEELARLSELEGSGELGRKAVALMRRFNG